MPKENINYPTSEWRDGPNGSSTDEHGGTQVSLHWDGNLVQVGVAIHIETLREVIRLHDEGDWVGREDAQHRVSFYTEALDRQDLQRMIRYGRRARDAAFGSDE